MQKTAQTMGIWNTIKEHTNLGGLAQENIFDPEFKEIMERLRTQTDDPVRAIVSGQQINNASPPDNKSLKDLLKSARTNFNRREYMKCVADLGRFHKRMNDVVSILMKFDANLDKVHQKFLFNQLTPDSPDYDPEYAEYMHDLKQRFSPPATTASVNYSLTKEAGILDFFKNIGTERGRALAAWEKRYPGRVKELKSQISSLLSMSDNLLSKTLSVLKTMASHRAARRVDDYIKEYNKIIANYKVYDANFKAVYDKHLKRFVEDQAFIAPSKDVKDPEAVADQDVKATPVGKAGPNPFALPGAKVTDQSTKVPASTPGAQSLLPVSIIDPAISGPFKAQLPLGSLVPSGQRALGPAEGDVPPATAPAAAAPAVAAPAVAAPAVVAPAVDPSAPPAAAPAPPAAPPAVVSQSPAQRALQKAKRGKVPQTTAPAAAPPPAQTAKASVRDEFPEISDPEIRSGMGLPPLNRPKPPPPPQQPVKTPEVLMRRPLRPPPSKPRVDAHRRFMESLESMAGEHPIILSRYITKYANSIKESDPDTYNKLIDIVESIKV